MKLLALICGVLCLTVQGIAAAKSCAGVDFPDHVSVKSTDLTLNGLGMRKATLLKINVYVAALYFPKPTTDATTLIDPAEPAQLVLRFVRNVGVKDLKGAWKEGFEKAAPETMTTLAARVAQLNSWMSDMKQGQKLTFTRLPARGVQVNVDGANKGTITGDDFSRALFTIWLGAKPPNSEIKAGLLGGACS
jgi:hypothetical protein